MNQITLELLVDVFRDAVNIIERHLDEDQEVVDAEYQYLSIVLTSLELILTEVDNIGFSDSEKLAIASSRIPGILHLYQLYIDS